MKKTLHIDSVIEGVRLRMKTETSNGVNVDFIGTFGRGNLQSRLLFSAVATVEDLIDTIEVELEDQDAHRIVKFGSMVSKQTDAQATLVSSAKRKMSP